MDKVIHHVLILTGENALIYVKYDHEVTHLEVYQEFHKLGVEVKDCYMQQSQSYNLAEILLKAVNKWVLRNFEEGYTTRPANSSLNSILRVWMSCEAKMIFYLA